MNGEADATVVWLAPAEVEGDAALALTEWGRAHGVRLVSSAESDGRASQPIDVAVGDRVERELDRARDAVSGLDADAADRALARAESILREHPELPQAAWLRAEVLRTWAARWMRAEPHDEARARTAWQEADALDGGRVSGVGERAFPRATSTPVVVTVHGAGAGSTPPGGRSERLTLRVDGIPAKPANLSPMVATYDLEVLPGEHPFTVTIDGALVFASWVSVAATTGGAKAMVVDIPLPDGGRCGPDAFGGVSRDDLQVRAEGVTCARWVAAAPGPRRGSILVARCEGASCGPLLEWRHESAVANGSPTKLPAERGGWPAWATWTLLGVGAAAVATTALAAAGVFESRPVEPRFVGGGVRVE